MESTDLSLVNGVDWGECEAAGKESKDSRRVGTKSTLVNEQCTLRELAWLDLKMKALNRTCGGVLSTQTAGENLQHEEVIPPNCHEELNLHDCGDSFILSDCFMVADVVSMTPKYGWWNVVDGAMLQRFSSNKPQNVNQRWLRLEKKAAKVGKGLFKNVKGRKLVSQHWLEAIDPLHRYGHNLRFYFEEWCRSHTHEPFFYWLDSGEGKDLDLEKCRKATLLSERIRYLGPKEREAFEVIVHEGKLVHKQTKEHVNTTKDHKWIFVMSTSGVLYIGKKEKGALQHSSFVAGAAITAAGRLRVKHGIIKLVEAHSGHYRPTLENFQQLITILSSRGADLTRAKIQYSSEEMLNPLQSSQSIPGEEKTTKMDTGTHMLTKSPSKHSKGSFDAANRHSDDEHAEKEDLVRDLRGLNLNGNDDIFKQEKCKQEEDGLDHSPSFGRKWSLLKDNGVERIKGLHSRDEQESTSNEAESRDPAARNENYADIGKVQVERTGSGSEGDGPDHGQGFQVSVVQSTQKPPPSLQDEEVVNGNIEEVHADHTSQGHSQAV